MALACLPAWPGRAVGQDVASATVVDAVVARVNGQPILFSQLRESCGDDRAPLGPELALDPTDTAFRRALTQVVDETLLQQKALREDIKNDDAQVADEVDRRVNALRDAQGGREGLDRWLNGNRLTLAQLRDVLSERERRRDLATKIVARGLAVDAPALESFVASRRKDGGPLEMINLAQVLVPCSEAEQRSEAGGGAFAQAIQAARRLARDFGHRRESAPMADDAGDAAGAPDIQTLGWLDPAELLPPLRDQAARMRPGDVSLPIATAQGFHVLLLTGRRSARDLAYVDLFEKRRVALAGQLRRQGRVLLFDAQGRTLDASAPPAQDDAPTTGSTANDDAATTGSTAKFR
jgi:parvulin-like peptidyl-prolyl isomerase